jgi:hypothetical protein
MTEPARKGSGQQSRMRMQGGILGNGAAQGMVRRRADHFTYEDDGQLPGTESTKVIQRMLKIHASSIRIKIIVLVIGPMAAIFIMSEGYTYWNSYEISLKDDRDKALSIAKSTAGISSYTFLTSDHAILDEPIQKPCGQEDFNYSKIAREYCNKCHDKVNEKNAVHKPVKEENCTKYLDPHQ